MEEGGHSVSQLHWTDVDTEVDVTAHIAEKAVEGKLDFIRRASQGAPSAELRKEENPGFRLRLLTWEPLWVLGIHLCPQGDFSGSGALLWPV